MSCASNFDSSRALRAGLVRVTCLAVLALCLLACGDSQADAPNAKRSAAILDRLSDESIPADEQLQRILAEGRDGNTDAVPALIRVMKHRSQCSFLVEDDPDAPFGYKTVEFKKVGEDVLPARRVAAIVALERIGSVRPLPDLLMALDDKDFKVRAHAARALMRLGSRAGMPVLLALLDEKAYGNETANAMLEEIAGESKGYHQDAGLAERMAARDRWKTWWAQRSRATERLPIEGRPYQIGLDGETDRRIHFFVAVIGQLQFKYHEEARELMQRMGVPGLAFLRSAVDRVRARDAQVAGSQFANTLLAGVAQVLEAISHPNSVELLAQLLKDQHPTVRSRAAESLGKLATDDAVHTLASGLEDADVSVVIETAKALGRAKTALAVRTLEGWKPGEQATLANTRLAGLFVATGGRRERDSVLGMLVGEDIGARNLAHEALREVTGQEVVTNHAGGPEVWLRAREQYAKLLAP